MGAMDTATLASCGLLGSLDSLESREPSKSLFFTHEVKGHLGSLWSELLLLNRSH